MPRRAEQLAQVARVLRAHRDDYALIVTREMGKPLRESRAEVEKCAWNFEFYASQAQRMLEDTLVESSASDSRVVYDPLGVVLAVMPWNYPFWQAMRAAAPILAGGNVLVLKHASNVPQCALALEQTFKEAGAPEGLFTTLLVGSARVAGLIDHPHVAAVTFTGSTPAGQAIASQAGHALKKQVLELGGSDPFIVLADADVRAAAATAVRGRFQNTGQSCIAAKRFIVEDRIADAFADEVGKLTAQLVVGDPELAETTLGPMAQTRLRDDLDAQVRATVSEGAKLRLGGKPVAGPGAFFQPTVLDHVQPGMTMARFETFGPAAAILRVKDAEQAIEVANETEFGLGAALWTSDLDRARSLSRAIDAGAVFVNGMVASDPRLPFGGTKRSGYGRELGVWGLREFCNVKTVWTGPSR
ncbi:Succinate-semialdehyde dehydrogenase/glutarate-semialdehyde dehydrogenase OS=Castellaniella defragrans OX=75697 GN=HNR28_001799 PE=3 SV=1 [Castellaniella defragrans]